MSEKHGLGPFASQINLQPDPNVPDGKTGIPVIDAAEDIYKKLFIDSATGCYNRNFFDDFIENKFNPRRGDEASIIMCDVNGLKEINDKNEGGHSLGDALLKRTAIFLKENFIRKGDLVVRYGGDEFIVICSHVGDKDKFTKEVNQRFNINNQKKKNINFAFGIAHFDSQIDIDGLAIPGKQNEDKMKQTTFNRADRLMYSKKAEQKSQANLTSHPSTNE